MYLLFIKIIKGMIKRGKYKLFEITSDEQMIFNYRNFSSQICYNNLYNK